MVKLKENREKHSLVVGVYLRNEDGKRKTDYKDFRGWDSVTRYLCDYSEPKGWTIDRIIVDKDIRLW